MAVAALPLFIVLVGYHRWRRICPLAWINQIPVRLGRAGTRRMPAWLERHYYYVSLGGFVVGLWLRLIWTNGDGVAIALFFAGLSLLALFAGALTTGKSWCNYLCPVSFIEKVYTEPVGLRQTQNSQCTTCTACKKACPDINEENAYWREIDLPSKRIAYLAYPGLIFGFYFYYFLQSGTWDYYFGGSWTDQPGVMWHAFLPGQDAASAGFFFLPWIPRALAALVTLLGCAAVSWFAFTVVVERIVVRRLRQVPAANARNVVFALAAFAAFVTFYTFAGQPTLRRVDWLPPWAAIVTVTVAAFTLIRRLRRTQDAFVEQAVARNLVKRWQWGDAPPSNPHDVILVHQTYSQSREQAHSDVRKSYRDSVRQAVAEGLLTPEDLERLGPIRDRLRISAAEHERVMLELAEEEAPGLVAGLSPASPEKRLQLVGYLRALQPQLERSLEPDGALDADALTRLQTRYAVTPDEHQQVLDELRGRSPRASEAVEALLGRFGAIEAALPVLEQQESPTLDFLAQLLRRQQDRARERILALLPDSADRLVVTSGGSAPMSVEDVLRENLSDRDLYVRALVVAALRERGMMGGDVQRMTEDQSELVRETAIADVSTTTTLDKMLALRQVSVFRHLEAASLLSLAQASKLEHYSPGDALCVEREPGRDVLILLSGEADVSRAGPGGQRLLNVQRAGAVVGEMAVLEPGPRSATVRVREGGAAVLRLPGSAFRDVVAADSDVATTVIQTLVRRLRQSELDPTEPEGPVSVCA